MNRYVENLNHVKYEERLRAITQLEREIENGKIEKPNSGGYINNHIHTWYSFSPYSPTRAVWEAYVAGLDTAGIVDHDNAAGAFEFIEAGEIVGIATTVGMECRADFSDTPLKGKRLNHPDQLSAAYVVIHGIPHNRIEDTNNFFKASINERSKRTKKMTELISAYLKQWGITLSYESDVVPISKLEEGGTITERHLLFAAATKLTERFGRGKHLVSFITDELKLNIPTKIESYLTDSNNPFYKYDLLGLLKSDFLERFYIPATTECYPVARVIDFANQIHAIPAYAYLGDIEESVTGDKKAQKFEDSYLEELFETIIKLGFKAVTYMPSRNTEKQIERVSGLCERYNLMQICGEDINSPRQSFVGKAITADKYPLLVDSTWALIAHEQLATEDEKNALFSRETISKYPNLSERIEIFAKRGKNMNGGKK